MRTPAAISWLVDIIIEVIPIEIDENMHTIALAYSTDSFWWIVITLGFEKRGTQNMMGAPIHNVANLRKKTIFYSPSPPPLPPGFASED